MYKVNKTDKNPTCVNILKLQRYNFKFLSLEEIVFLEYLIVKARSFGFKEFYHSSATIEEETGIKRTKLESIIRRFTDDLHIIKVTKKGFPVVKHFTVDFEIIYELLPNIYQSAENRKPSADLLKLLSDFYTPLVESYRKKNIHSSISNQDINKEKQVGDTDWDVFAHSFNDFLFELKLKRNLTDTQLKYSEQHLFTLYSNYDQETIFKSLQRYFETTIFQASVNNFLKTPKLSPKKNEFIEKQQAEEKRLATSLLKKLESTFNARRERASTSKKSYSKTALAINNAITEKVLKVLKTKSENDIDNAFIAYTDAIIAGEIYPEKILPYFFTENYGEYSVIDSYLDHFNVYYARRSN